MEITIKRVWRSQDTTAKMKGRVDVDLITESGDAITINGVKVIEGPNGQFIGMPSQKGSKPDPKTGKDIYYDIVKLSKDAHYRLQDAILKEFGVEQVGAPQRPANKATRTPVAAGNIKKPAAPVSTEESLEEDPPF
jgi:DNA-binding cell septation regulator SpoVG